MVPPDSPAPTYSPGVSTPYLTIFLQIALLTGLLVLLTWQSSHFPQAIAFKNSIITDLGGLIASYSVVSLALQSALEIFVTNVREPAKIEQLQRELTNQELSSSPATITDPKQEKFKNNTRKITYALSFGVSLVVSLGGFRILQSLVVSNNLDGLQLQLFQAIDILLSTCLLSGGADGVHQITQAYDDFIRPQNPPQK